MDRKDSGRLHLVLAALMHLAAACSSDGQCSKESSETPGTSNATKHGGNFKASRSETAREALTLLLSARHDLATREFDGAIKQLTAVICLGAETDQLRAIEQLSVDQLYPSNISRCVYIDCGHCRTREGHVLLGPAFTEVPRLGVPPWPKDEDVIITRDIDSMEKP